MTTPDQTMSMRTILDRYAKGLPVADGKEPIWDDDAENAAGINPKTLDLVDLQEIASNNKVKIEQLRSQAQTDVEIARRAKKEKEEKAKQQLFDEFKKATEAPQH